MNFIRFFSIFFFMSSFIYADPRDYPPTAFQLAQIVHYAEHEVDVRSALWDKKSSTALKNSQDAQEKFLEGKPAENFLIESEKIIAEHIDGKADITESDWYDFVNHMIDRINKRKKQDGFAESFEEEGSKELIVKAILEELQAMKNGQAILWRAVESRKEFSLGGQYQGSYSYGLFSGFLFDGFTYHYRPLRWGTGSACTYSYFSAHLRIKRCIKEVESGVASEKVRANVVTNIQKACPEFFAKGDKFPGILEMRDESLSDFIEKYNLESLVNLIEKFYEKCPSLKLDEHKEKISKARRFLEVFKNWQPTVDKDAPDFTLFGVCVGPKKLNENYLSAEFAVYGRGEYFHPKEKFSDKFETCIIYRASS